MGIKSKHVAVAAVSSVIIAIVLVSTLVVYSFYIDWREDNVDAMYNNSIYELTADMFKDNIGLVNLKTGIGEDGVFKGMPIVEGRIRNNSSKVVTSLMLEISFARPDGSVMCRERFYPLGEHTRKALKQGEGISFRHLLKSCSDEVVSQLSTMSGFARADDNERIVIEYSIAGMSVS